MYKNNEEIRFTIMMCPALDFIPLLDIDDGWLIVMDLSPNNYKSKSIS